MLIDDSSDVGELLADEGFSISAVCRDYCTLAGGWLAVRVWGGRSRGRAVSVHEHMKVNSSVCMCARIKKKNWSPLLIISGLLLLPPFVVCSEDSLKTLLLPLLLDPLRPLLPH